MISSKEQVKKTKEQEILDAFFKIGCKNHGKKRRLIKSVKGTKINRTKDEQPDFVMLVNRPNGEKVIVGIELFRIDQVSTQRIKNRGKKTEQITRTSLNKELEYSIRQKEELFQALSKNDYSTIMKCLNEFWITFQSNLNKVTYKSFIDDFTFHFSNHLNKINVYRNNLEMIKKELGADNIELGFLLEAHVEFSRYILIKNGNILEGQKNNNNKFIYFEDFVSKLEKIDKKLLDYFFIISGNSEFSDNKHINVEAFKTDNIRNQLKQKNHEIYEFAGEDYLYDDSDIKISISEKNNEGFILNKHVDKEIFQYSAIISGMRLLNCINNKNNIVTTHDELDFLLKNPEVTFILKNLYSKNLINRREI